jgi:nitric oxide reductase subunit B
MLAVGFAMFALRYLIPEDRWNDKWPRISFWSLNLGLAWMSFATLLPGGALQLYKVLDAGYADARSLGYLQGHANAVLEWLRLPGDVVFIAGGVLPVLWMTWQGVRYRNSGALADGSGATAGATGAEGLDMAALDDLDFAEQDLLFTEIVPAEAAAGGPEET